MPTQDRPVVLITGCSSGIGRALALEFHRQSYYVYATARQVDEIASLKQPGLEIAQLDVTNQNHIASIIQQIKQQTGRLDLLINNAGYAAVGPLLEIPLYEVQAQFMTNVFAPLELTQQIVPLMIAQGSGTIVNIGSVSGILATPFAGSYCASKAALHALSHTLRMELAPFNIQVVTVQTGAIESNIGQAATARLSQTLADPSHYSTIQNHIRDRALISQRNATPTEAYAHRLVKALKRKPTPTWITLGYHSRWLPFLQRWLPRPLQDQILMRKFGLLLNRSPLQK